MTRTLKVTHNAGLFSCFSQRLSAIIHYGYQYKMYPDEVDSSVQFDMYKAPGDGDITKYLLKPAVGTIPFIEGVHFTDQFTDYSRLGIDLLNPLVDHYFGISDMARYSYRDMITKYGITLDNTCSILYRGNDKITECALGSYEQYGDRVQKLLQAEPQLDLLVQTDDTMFLDYFCGRYKSTIYIKEMPTIADKSLSVSAVLPRDKRLSHAIDLLAAINVVAGCKYLVTHTGNCGYWAALYRTHTSNIIQFDPTNGWLA